MYSNIKSVQLMISALKEYNIRHIVLSPGGSDIPIVHSIEIDTFFHTYSVVDERSAAYFGLGLSQQLNMPVAIVCTSGTAVSNYLPGITEAFYQDVPLIAITADKDPYFQGQIQTQKIEQKGIFGECVRASVDLPFCRDKKEVWYCERLIKEAFYACFQKTHGPVHINIPIVSAYNVYDCNVLPTIRKVNYMNCETPRNLWDSYFHVLHSAKRIMVFVGQDVVFNDEDIQVLDTFFKHYNVLFSVEHHSNLKFEGCVYTYPVTETQIPKDATLVPDLVISIGNNVSGYSMKPFLRRNSHLFRHIGIDVNGRFRDVFQGLTDLFECTPQTFFRYFANGLDNSYVNDYKYYKVWQDKVAKVVVPDFSFSEICVAKYLTEIIPENSTLHTAILNSSRVIQYFPLAKGVKTYSNLGALGIDGCMSTFMGHAAATEELCFLLIGDLAFFYDMNAAGLRSLNNNVRIVLMNNGGGSEFHLFLNKNDVPSMNDNICAQHSKIAEGWITSLGYEYTSVRNIDELEKAMATFANPSERPKFIEIFSNLESDAQITMSFYKSFAEPYNLSEFIRKVKEHLIK